MQANQYTIYIPSSLATDKEDPQTPINALRKYYNNIDNQEKHNQLEHQQYKNQKRSQSVPTAPATNIVRKPASIINTHIQSAKMNANNIDHNKNNGNVRKLFENNTAANRNYVMQQQKSMENNQQRKNMVQCFKISAFNQQLSQQIDILKSLINQQTRTSQTYINKIKNINSQIAHWQRGYFDCTKNLIDTQQHIANAHQQIRQNKLIQTFGLNQRNSTEVLQVSQEHRQSYQQVQRIQRPGGARRKLKISLSQQKLHFIKQQRKIDYQSSPAEQKQVITHDNSFQNSHSGQNNTSSLFEEQADLNPQQTNGVYIKASSSQPARKDKSDNFKKYRKVTPNPLWFDKQNIAPLFMVHKNHNPCVQKPPCKQEQLSYACSYKQKNKVGQDKYSDRYANSKTNSNQQQRKNRIWNNYSGQKSKPDVHQKPTYTSKINVKVNISAVRGRKILG